MFIISVATLIFIQNTEQAVFYRRDCLTDNCNEPSNVIFGQRIQPPTPPGTYKASPIRNRLRERNEFSTRRTRNSYFPVLLLYKPLFHKFNGRNKKIEGKSLNIVINQSDQSVPNKLKLNYSIKKNNGKDFKKTIKKRGNMPKKLSCEVSCFFICVCF